MELKTYLPYLFLLFVSAGSLRGQYYTTGQDPASVRWLQIRTDTFRIVFPESFRSRGPYLANLFSMSAKFETKTLRARIPRIPVLVHTSSIESNGLTVWAPRRIELYPCPPQDIYPEPWLEQLALHEYRHAVQTSKMNRGFTHALYYIFGEQVTGAVLGLFIPRWFLEGDATVTETALSSSGRGRVASFPAPLRAQLLQKGIYPYDLATLGSYKTYTPDPYVLGYHLVAKGREHHGYEIWDRILDKVAKLPFMVVPFNAEIRKQTGQWKTAWYRSVMEELSICWQEEEERSWQSLYTQVTRPNPLNYTTYDSPQFLTDSIVAAACRDNEGVPRILFTDRSGNVCRSIRVGPYQPGSLTVSGNLVAWTEMRPDIRWANRSYSVIRMAQVDTWRGGQVGAGHAPSLRDITRRSRYFAPALSPDGHRLAAVRVDLDNRSFLDILDVATGSVLDTIPAPEEGLFLQPSWSPDGRTIAFLLLSSDGKSIQTIHPGDSTCTVYLNPSFREISGPPKFYRNYLLFSAGYNGIENIYAVDTLTRQLYQVTSARFQAKHPAVSPNGTTLVYSDYCADGMMVVSRDTDPSKWIPLSGIPDYIFELAEAMAEQEGVNIQDSLLQDARCQMPDASSRYPASGIRHPASDFAVSRYRKAAHLFNVHSWAPASINANNMTLKPGVSLISQNLLSTAFAGAGYEYDLSERTGKFYLDFSYQGWFPVIDLQYSYGKRAGAGRFTNTGETFRYTWNESSLQASVSVPLKLSRGIWYRGIQPAVGTSWIYVIHDKTTPEQFTRGSVNTLDYLLSMYNYLRSNYQDMFPKWGQKLDINYRHTPFDGNDLGAVFGISSNLFFPGIFRHHGIRIYGGYQKRWDNLIYGYRFSNQIALPRGTEVIYPGELVSLSANYKFPFLRLDASLGSLLYIKRFTLNLFYDWAHGREASEDIFQQSAGFELTSEMHILRFIAPFELGIQGAWLPEENRWNWRFLWGVFF